MNLLKVIAIALSSFALLTDVQRASFDRTGRPVRAAVASLSRGSVGRYCRSLHCVKCNSLFGKRLVKE